MVIALVSTAVRYERQESRKTIQRLLNDLEIGRLESFPRSSGSSRATNLHNETESEQKENEESGEENMEDKNARYRWCIVVQFE